MLRPLDAGVDGLFAERKEALARNGYVAPATVDALVDPRTSAYVQEWWDRSFGVAEYNHESGAYPQMPDDYTPSKTLGQATTGYRRTHRMCYRGAGVSLRMPSATAIRRFAQETGGTFDVPVSATYPGGDVSGWIRVTRTSDGGFAIRGLGFSPESSAYVAEAAHAVLEARRPSRALSEVGDLLERRRQRASALGVRTTALHSSWLRAAGYDGNSSTLVIATDRQPYGYRVPASVFTRITSSPEPGKVFNALVRGRATRVEVQACPKCGRFPPDMSMHRCPPSETRRVATAESNERHARRFLGR